MSAMRSLQYIFGVFLCVVEYGHFEEVICVPLCFLCRSLGVLSILVQFAICSGIPRLVAKTIKAASLLKY